MIKLKINMTGPESRGSVERCWQAVAGLAGRLHLRGQGLDRICSRFRR